MSAALILDWGLGLAQAMLTLAMALAGWRMIRGRGRRTGSSASIRST